MIIRIIVGIPIPMPTPSAILSPRLYPLLSPPPPSVVGQTGTCVVKVAGKVVGNPSDPSVEIADVTVTFATAID
jgi:hypothetical protein